MLLKLRKIIPLLHTLQKKHQNREIRTAHVAINFVPFKPKYYTWDKDTNLSKKSPIISSSKNLSKSDIQKRILYEIGTFFNFISFP